MNCFANQKKNIAIHFMLTIAAWTLIPVACFSCLPTDDRKSPIKFMGDESSLTSPIILKNSIYGLRADKVSVFLNWLYLSIIIFCFLLEKKYHVYFKY